MKASNKAWLVVAIIILVIVWVFLATVRDGKRLLNPSDREAEPVPYHSAR